MKHATMTSTETDYIFRSPFLQFVSDIDSFDYQLSTYVKESYVKDKYVPHLGYCRNLSKSSAYPS